VVGVGSHRTVPARSRRGGELRVAQYARIDRHRGRRLGVPEVVLAEGKTVVQLVGIVETLHREGVGALLSRPSAAQRQALRRLARAGIPLRERASGRVVRLAGPLGAEYRPGVVALVTAGTSDVAIAEEARAVLEELGIEVLTAYDVGVAGLHRLLSALRRLERRAPELYLVIAGREGALPTVVAGLVHAPVVGIPASVGYGRGGRGEAALGAMLQSCAPLAVVNIDAAVPAALFAAQRFAIRPQLASRRRAGARRPT
jgi:pyridinium-3,5-biscarboxylic acid mononucleotide synthase